MIPVDRRSPRLLPRLLWISIGDLWRRLVDLIGGRA